MSEEIEADGPAKRALFLALYTVTEVLVPLAAVVGLFVGIAYFAAPYFQWAAIQILEFSRDGVTILMSVMLVLSLTLTIRTIRRWSA